MWRIIVLLVFSTTISAEETKAVIVEQFKTILQDAAATIIRDQKDDMSRPPEFNMPADFMRSFVPNTGVGNREEIIIESLKEVQIFYDFNFTHWQYQRFNNTNYLLGASDRLVVLNKMDSEFLEFSKDESSFTFTPSHKSVVKDTTIFTRSVKRSVSLYVAILTESVNTYHVHVFEIIGNKGLQVGLITLSPSYLDPFVIKRLSYVQSKNGGSLVVLINTQDVTEITYKQEGSMESNHYIEVRYPSAVDIITYKIHGHGYIAVTNSTTCQIFKMDQFSKSNLLFDSIHSPQGDIVNLEYFRLGFHHYLAVAGRSRQYLYVWKSGEYAWRQSFDGHNIKQVYSATIPSCRDDVILFFAGEESVQVFIYSGNEEIFIKSDVDIPHNFNFNPRSVTSFTRKNKAVILFLNKEWILKAFIIDTKLKSIPNPILEEGQKVYKYMESIQEMLKEQSKQVQYIKDVLQNAVRKTGNQTITSFQTFDELHSSEGAIVEKINSTIFVEWDDSDLTLDQYKKGADWLENSVTELEKLVDEIEKVIPDVVRIDEDMEVIGKKHFIGDITGSSISALSVNLESVGGINLPKLQEEIYRLDKPQKIEGTLIFEKPLTITGDLNVDSTVNGIDISEDVMTTNTDQISFAHMSFEKKITIHGDLDISGTLNGIKVKDEVVTLSGSHFIKGRKTFQNGLIAENVTAKFIDGVDIDDLYLNAFTKSGRQEIPGTKTFSGGLETVDIRLDGKLNGFDVSELAQSVVRIDKPAVITGHKTFLEDVTIDSTLTVQGKVNDLRIPEDLFLTDVAQEVTGFKEFTGIVFANDVQVSGEIDGLRIPDDIVTLSGDEEIPGTLLFTDGIDVMGDINVEGHVDGVDISEVAKQALKLNDSHEFENAVFFGPVTVTDNLEVSGLVNNVNLNELVRDIVFKDEPNAVIDSEKRFKKVVAEQVNLDKMINGYNLSEDFMKVHGDQIISGVKTFKDSVTFHTLNVDNGLIGDVNITRFYENRLSLMIEEEMDKDIEFSNEVIVEGDLVVHGTIGGLRIPDDIVLKNSTHPISNKVFTNYVKVDNLVVNGDVEASESFGGVNLREFHDNRITLDEDHMIEGDISIGGSSVGKLDIAGDVNGIDIAEFAKNVMSKTKDQIITAPKNFIGTTVVHGKITTEEGVNGYDLKSLNKRAFKLYENNVVTGNFEFQDIKVNDLTVGGFINGVNLTYLAENSLKKKGLQYVTGATIFENGFHVNGNIDADFVNDMVIPEDILLKTTPQTITGQYTLGNLGISGDLIVQGHVNGLDLSEVAPQLARIDQETILVSNVTFVGPIRVIKDITVSGLVNGVDLNRLSDNVLLKSGYQEIFGNKVLKGNVTIKGDVDVDFVNGVDWKQFLSDVVWIDRPQNITSPKTFVGDVEAEDVYSALTKVKLVNGKDLNKLMEEAVFIDVPTNITGRKVFKSPVEITGDMTAELINGLQLKTDVVTLMCSEGGPQIITGQKTFQKVTAFSNSIEVAGKVNSYDLYELYKDTLMVEGEQEIEGHKILTNEVTFLKNVHPNTVNGMKLKNSLVTLDSQQYIEGPVVFNGDVYLEKNLRVTGLIDNVNITKLAEDAVFLDRDQTLHGKFYFQKVVAASDVAVSGTVNGLNLIAFEKNVTEFWKDATDSLNAIERHSEDNCEMLKYLQNVLSKSYYVLVGFTLHQDLDYSASYFHIKNPKEITLVSLNDIEYEATAVPFTWEHTSKGFVSGEPSQTTIARTIVKTVGFTEVSVHIGIFEKDSHVLINKSRSSFPDGFKEASVIVRKNNEVVIGLLFPSNGKCELYRLVNLFDDSIDVETYGTINVGKESMSIAMFDIGETVYLALSRHYVPPYIRGFCKIFGRVHDGWQRIQSFSVASSTSVKHFLYHGYHYLAFTNVAPVHETREPKSIQIYRNSGPNELFFTLFQKVPFDDAKGIEIFEFGDLSELYLTTWNETVVQVFRLEGESGLRNTFTVHGRCIKDVKALLIEDDIYLLVGQENLRTNQPVSSVLYRGLTQGTKFTPHNFTYC